MQLSFDIISPTQYLQTMGEPENNTVNKLILSISILSGVLLIEKETKKI
jgi:hypothetical protein